MVKFYCDKCGNECQCPQVDGTGFYHAYTLADITIHLAYCFNLPQKPPDRVHFCPSCLLNMLIEIVKPAPFVPPPKRKIE